MKGERFVLLCREYYPNLLLNLSFSSSGASAHTLIAALLFQTLLLLLLLGIGNDVDDSHSIIVIHSVFQFRFALLSIT